MKLRWITAITAATLAVPAFSQVGVYIGTPPPPVRYERRPPPPGPGVVWVDGYWGVQGRRYAWVPGHWERPPFAGAYWTHPHYDHYQNGWRIHEGRWDHEDHGGYPNEGDHRDNGRRDDHHDNRR